MVGDNLIFVVRNDHDDNSLSKSSGKSTSATSPEWLRDRDPFITIKGGKGDLILSAAVENVLATVYLLVTADGVQFARAQLLREHGSATSLKKQSSR